MRLFLQFASTLATFAAGRVHRDTLRGVNTQKASGRREETKLEEKGKRKFQNGQVSNFQTARSAAAIRRKLVLLMFIAFARARRTSDKTLRRHEQHEDITARRAVASSHFASRSHRNARKALKAVSDVLLLFCLNAFGAR